MTHTPVSDQDTPEQDAVRIRYARVTLAGKQIAAPKTYGKGAYKAIEPAPGRYVKAKA